MVGAICRSEKLSLTSSGRAGRYITYPKTIAEYLWELVHLTHFAVSHHLHRGVKKKATVSFAINRQHGHSYIPQEAYQKPQLCMSIVIGLESLIDSDRILSD